MVESYAVRIFVRSYVITNMRRRRGTPLESGHAGLGSVRRHGALLIPAGPIGRRRVVEQLADEAIAIADHVTVLDGGRVVAEGTPAEFADAEKLEVAYFAA
jgi:hypothetical protein